MAMSTAFKGSASVPLGVVAAVEAVVVRIGEGVVVSSVEIPILLVKSICRGAGRPNRDALVACKSMTFNKTGDYHFHTTKIGQSLFPRLRDSPPAPRGESRNLGNRI